MNPHLKIETWGTRFNGYGNEMVATGASGWTLGVRQAHTAQTRRTS
jgi:hypothetical protein